MKSAMTANKITEDDYIITFIAQIERGFEAEKVVRLEHVYIITTDENGITGAWKRAMSKALNLGGGYEPYILMEIKLSRNDTEIA